MIGIKRILCVIAVMNFGSLIAMEMELEIATRKALVKMALSKITIPAGLTETHIKEACDVTENWAFSFENDLDQYTAFLTKQLNYRSNSTDELITILCGRSNEYGGKPKADQKS